MARSTSNGNCNGNATGRRRRRQWLVETFRADVDGQWALICGVRLLIPVSRDNLFAPAEPCCRCYRCGCLLTVDGDPERPAVNGCAAPGQVTADRIVPGAKGGTYRRDNIRPACSGCNSSTGGALGASRRGTSTTTKRKKVA